MELPELSVDLYTSFLKFWFQVREKHSDVSKVDRIIGWIIDDCEKMNYLTDVMNTLKYDLTFDDL